MGATRNQVAACAALLATACQSDSDAMDLRRNPDLYADTGYAARAAVDRAAFVAPMVDAREPATEASGGARSTSWLSDAVWARPPLVMIEEILRDELAASGVFTELLEEPRADALILTPYLDELRYGEEEQVYRRRAIAQVAVRVVVHGPGASVEQRAVLFDRTFEELAATKPQLAPPSSALFVGLALRKVMSKVLGALDQSNVTRSQVPDDADIAGLR